MAEILYRCFLPGAMRIMAALRRAGSIQEREAKAVAADVRRRSSIANRNPSPHVGGYVSYGAPLPSNEARRNLSLKESQIVVEDPVGHRPGNAE